MAGVHQLITNTNKRAPVGELAQVSIPVMDILQPALYWVDNRCYRKNPGRLEMTDSGTSSAREDSPSTQPCNLFVRPAPQLLM